MDKVECKVCGFKSHILVQHINSQHTDLGEDPVIAYLDKYPDASLWSGYGLAMIRKHSKAAVTAPRPKKQVKIDTLFPDFARRKGHKEMTGTLEIFEHPGPLTPEPREHYVFPIDQTLDILVILEKSARNRVYVKGWSGTGKTELIFALASKINAEVMEWNADAFQQRSSLIGQWTVKDGETVWDYGILPQAMKRGCILIINEIDTIDPLTLNLLKPVLEDPARLTILENGGETITAHPDFRIIATANTWARGDVTGMFVNTMVQSVADQRRWSAFVLLDYMNPADEEAMLHRYFTDLEASEPKAFVDVANKIRDAFKAGKIGKTISPAEVINWVENFLACGRGPHHAARLSFLNACEPSDAAAVEEMIVAVFGAERGESTPSKDEEGEE